MRGALLLSAAAAVLLSSAAFATTAPLTPGNLVVAVSGRGASGITFTDNQASPLSLYQYTPTTRNAAVLAGKSVVTGSTAAGFSSEYGSSSEGLLQRSGDGKSLTIMGYGIDATTFNNATSCDAATNVCTNSYVPQTAANNGKLAALAQTSSVPGTANGLSGANAGTVPTVARVIANITADGNVDTSTALLNVFDQNNPRSVWTKDGSTYYVSGQGLSGDTTGGVYYTTKGATSATPVTGRDTGTTDSTGATVPNSANQDTRDVTVYKGQIYVTEDTKSGKDAARSYVGTLGADPFTSSADPSTLSNPPVVLPGFGGLAAGSTTGSGVVTIASNGSNGNGLNNGKTVSLSPEQIFFASDSVMYVTDTGNTKQSVGSATGDGGLQKWVLQNGVWTLAYTISSVVPLNGIGSSLVNNKAASGVTGLFGLAGQVNGDTVSLYATSYTIGDTDTSYLYAITDSLSAPTKASGDSLYVVDALSGSKFMGLAFAPDAAAAPMPEPASWAMMIGGFALVGTALRRRRHAYA